MNKIKIKNILFLNISRRELSSLSPSSNAIEKKTIALEDIDGVFRTLRYVDIGDNKDPHPIVILGGTAQSIDTFASHLRAFSKNRRLILPELRFQGDTKLIVNNEIQIKTLIEDFEKFLIGMNIYNKCTIDLIGFSFGGRVAMAIAAYKNNLIHKLSINCVPLIRPTLGLCIMNSWHMSLKNNELKSCYWSFLINGYSEKFINKNYNQFENFIGNIMKSNPNPQKIIHLLENTILNIDDNEEYNVKKCSELIKCPVQIIGANEDRIAGTNHVYDLYINIKSHNKNICNYIVMDGGHLVPFENPIVWRNHILEFFNNHV